jgi:uncharacterized protein
MTFASAEDVSPVTSRPVRRSWLVQRWDDLAFLHWAVDPAVVAPFLPRGTRPDTFEGQTYVGLIGFRMVRLGMVRGPGIPYLGTFCETNVRLYSVDAAGRRAVVFLSLDAERLIPVLVAQATLRLPYKWARMSLRRDGDAFTYTSRRRRASGSFTVRRGPAITDPTPLEHFLTARWGLHTRAWGRTLHLPNEHPQWPLHRATLEHLDETLIAATGLPAPAVPPVSVLSSPGVPVTFGGPQALPV